MDMIDTVLLSQEGQIALPEAFKAKFPNFSDMRFMLYSDGESVMLKSITSPGAAFKSHMKECQKIAEKAGLTEADIEESIKAVRAKRRK